MSKPVGAYRPIVRAGEWLVVSGQIGLNDGALVGGGFRDEVVQALDNLEGLLAGEGATLAQVVKTTVYLRHMGDYGILNEEWVGRFGDS
ncbi:MAG: RidA family protein, partial [Acidimicrobiales bacterium]